MRKKSDRQYRTFEASELRSNDSIAKNELLHLMGVAVWRAGDFRVSARTLPEPRQKHRFLQRPRAIWRAPVGTVEQLLLWIRIEAEQQRERDLTRRSAARRIGCGPTGAVAV